MGINRINPTKAQKASFVAQLEAIIPLLPVNYAAIINHTTGIDKKILYRVKNYKTVNYAVLTAMKDLVTQDPA